MPRSKRILEKNAIYHVYNRANNRRSINFTDFSYTYFLNLLFTLRKDFKVKVFAYCLMKNHYHLLLKTDDANLDKVMKYFGENFSLHINNETNGLGPVFQGRYRSKLVRDESYLLQVLRYIHLNPAESNERTDFLTYSWSSMSDYLNSVSCPLDRDFFLSRFTSLADFVAYHDLGNSVSLSKFYSKKFQPPVISKKTLLD